MTAHLSLEEVLERIEGDDCRLSSENDSDFKRDGIYGYMVEADITLSLGALCSEVVDAKKEDNLSPIYVMRFGRIQSINCNMCITKSHSCMSHMTCHKTELHSIPYDMTKSYATKSQRV